MLVVVVLSLLSDCFDRRPPLSQRKMVIPAVDVAVEQYSAILNKTDPELACLFKNALPNALDTTVVSFSRAPAKPDTFIITGDIPAMYRAHGSKTSSAHTSMHCDRDVPRARSPQVVARRRKSSAAVPALRHAVCQPAGHVRGLASAHDITSAR